MALGDFYLKIEGVEGEAVTGGHEKEMQISSYSFGGSNSSSWTVGTGGGTGRGVMHDFQFSIQNGKASPVLWNNCMIGTHIPTAQLSLRKTGGASKPYDFLIYKFEKVIISSFGTSGSDQGGLPMESCSFGFTKVTWEQYEQGDDGTVTLAKTASYDASMVEGQAG